jgi:hypothetical protein
MNDQRQSLRAVGHRHQQRAQRAVLQVEAALGFVAQRLQLFGRFGVALPQLGAGQQRAVACCQPSLPSTKRRRKASW